MARLGLLLLVLAALAATAGPALGDGKVFNAVGVVEPTTIPDQRALLCFDGRTQTLAIDTRFQGEGEDFAWLVPLPSAPEIEPVSEGLFPTLESLFARRVQTRVSEKWAPVLVLVTAALVLALLFRSRGTLLVFALVAVPLLLCAVLPTLGTSRRSLEGTPGVDVLDRRLVGVYDTAVLTGDDPTAVLDWLTGNGFAVPEGVESVVGEYLAQGWVFAAARLRDDDAGDAPRTPHPLAFRFATDRPVYPLRLTGVGNGDLEVEIYVFAEGSASIPGWDVAMSLPALDRPEEGFRAPYRRSMHEPIYVAHPELVRLTAALPVATHLRATLSEAAMRQDAVLRIGPLDERVPALYTREAAFAIAAQAGLVAAVACLALVHFVRLREGWPVSRGLVAGAAALAAAAVAGLIASWAVPVVDQSQVRLVRSDHKVLGLHGSVELQAWLALRECLPEDMPWERALERVPELVEAAAVEEGLPPPVMQASPGNYGLRREADGTIAYYTYDRVGAPVLMNYIWTPPAASNP